MWHKLYIFLFFAITITISVRAQEDSKAVSQSSPEDLIINNVLDPLIKFFNSLKLKLSMGKFVANHIVSKLQAKVGDGLVWLFDKILMLPRLLVKLLGQLIPGETGKKLQELEGKMATCAEQNKEALEPSEGKKVEQCATAPLKALFENLSTIADSLKQIFELAKREVEEVKKAQTTVEKMSQVSESWDKIKTESKPLLSKAIGAGLEGVTNLFKIPLCLVGDAGKAYLQQIDQYLEKYNECVGKKLNEEPAAAPPPAAPPAAPPAEAPAEAPPAEAPAAPPPAQPAQRR